MDLLVERWDAAEADFQRFYQLDLRDEVEHTGCRRIWALINSLPPEAAVWRMYPQKTKPDNTISVAEFHRLYRGMRKEKKPDA